MFGMVGQIIPTMAPLERADSVDSDGGLVCVVTSTTS